MPFSTISPFNNPSIFQHLKKSFYFLPFLNLKTCYLQRLQGSDLWSLASLVLRLLWSWLVWSPPCIKGNTKADWWYWLLDWLIYYNKQNLTQKCSSPPSAVFCIVSPRTLSHNPARINWWWSWSWIMSHHWWLYDDKLMNDELMSHHWWIDDHGHDLEWWQRWPEEAAYSQTQESPAGWMENYTGSSKARQLPEHEKVKQ